MAEKEELKETITQEKIKKILQNGPASINDICNAPSLKVAWATAKTALEEMVKKGDVKEIISSKIRVFARKDDPAFYNIPLSKKQKNDSLFLFSKIIEEWSKKESQPPLATVLQKIAVHVITDCNVKFNIPVVSFHYGKVVPVIYRMEKPEELEVPEHHLKMIECIRNVIAAYKNKAGFAEDEQYKKYGMKLFLARKQLVNLFNPLRNTEKRINVEEIKKTLNNLFLTWPNKDEDTEIFSLYHRYLLASMILLDSKNSKDYVAEIKENFDILWDLITTHLFFQEVRTYIPNEKLEIFELIKLAQLSVKSSGVEGRVIYIESLAKSFEAHIPKGGLYDEILGMYEELATEE